VTRLVRGVLFIAALGSPLACHGEADEARRAEAGRIAEAVRALRAASNDGKRPFLRSLHDLACSTEDLCRLKRSCQEAYELELSALDGISAVRRAVRGVDPIPPEAAELLTKSEGNLKRAAELTKACVESEGAVRRRYSL
jgi:hypothetical protein